MDPWNEAEKYYKQAMQAEDPGKSLELYDKCIETLLKAIEDEKIEKNRLLLFLNARQAEANKRTSLANMLKDKAYREKVLPDQAVKYLREAANYHLESVKFREEAASIAKEIGYAASYYNLLGCAYQDRAFYHSYLALEAQKNKDLKKALEEYKNAVKFLETALEHFNLSSNTSINKETENNRSQCLRYLENFRADLQAAIRDMLADNKGQMFIFILNDVRKIVDEPIDKDEKLLAICKLLKDNVPYYNWVGFYLVDQSRKRELVLGAFVGEPTEHKRILFGEGICGQAAERKVAFVVQDVSKEASYLSCSPEVKSEIVVPVLKNGEIVGELDIDSHIFSPFTEKDEKFLEDVCEIVSMLF